MDISKIKLNSDSPEYNIKDNKAVYNITVNNDTITLNKRDGSKSKPISINNIIDNYISTRSLDTLGLDIRSNYGIYFEYGTNIYESEDGDLCIYPNLGMEIYGKTYIDEDVSCRGSVSAKEFCNLSDKSLKENIKDISDLDKASKIEFKEFNFKENSTKKYGVIALQLEEIGLNNLVTTDEHKSVDYISLLVLKIQQLESEINKIKNPAQ